jgi:hypothetical protein
LALACPTALAFDVIAIAFVFKLLRGGGDASRIPPTTFSKCRLAVNSKNAPVWFSFGA